MNAEQNLAESLGYLAELTEKIKRGQTSRTDGKRYIIWGVMTALGFLGTQVLIWAEVDSFLYIAGLWILVAGIALAAASAVRSDVEAPRVFVSRVLSKIWSFLSLALFLFPAAVMIEARFVGAGALPMTIPVGEMVLLSVAAGIMGALLGVRYFYTVAWCGAGLVMLCALFPGLFGIWFAVMQTLILTVPGIMILKSGGQ